MAIHVNPDGPTIGRKPAGEGRCPSLPSWPKVPAVMPIRPCLPGPQLYQSGCHRSLARAVSGVVDCASEKNGSLESRNRR